MPRSWTPRADGDKPLLVICEDENDQADYLIRQILDRREASTLLRHQAVLFRASHHSILLETELARRSIPFHKYGGLKFVEAAHVKDLMAFLRLAENPRNVIAGTRILALLPGIGPRKAHQLIELLARSETGFEVWQSWKPPAASQRLWPEFVDLLAGLHRARTDLPGQIERVRTFYQPILDVQYDNPRPRARDLEQLAQIAARYRDRRTMLAEIALDPPASTQDLAGQPQLDDDYLVLSTIHSAKGLEWDAVYVIHASDGNIPSDMATGSSEEIEEELRLFYVALSRAKRWLTVCYPLRYYHYPSSFHGAYGFAQPTRFLPESALRHFQRADFRNPRPRRGRLGRSRSRSHQPFDPQSHQALLVVSVMVTLPQTSARVPLLGSRHVLPLRSPITLGPADARYIMVPLPQTTARVPLLGSRGASLRRTSSAERTVRHKWILEHTRVPPRSRRFIAPPSLNTLSPGGQAVRHAVPSVPVLRLPGSCSSFGPIRIPGTGVLELLSSQQQHQRIIPPEALPDRAAPRARGASSRSACGCSCA